VLHQQRADPLFKEFQIRWGRLGSPGGGRGDQPDPEGENSPTPANAVKCAHSSQILPGTGPAVCHGTESSRAGWGAERTQEWETFLEGGW
jgi:hypothetical protein